MVSEEAKAAVAAAEKKDAVNPTVWLTFVDAIQFDLHLAAVRHPEKASKVMIGTCLAMELDTACLNADPRVLMIQCQEFLAWILEWNLTPETRPAWVQFK